MEDSSADKYKGSTGFGDLEEPNLEEQLGAQVGTGGGQVLPRQSLSGMSRGVQYLGSKLVRVDSDAARIVLNDGENDRLIIGQKEGAF